jgi:transketolase N-terminal domain/subunit
VYTSSADSGKKVKLEAIMYASAKKVDNLIATVDFKMENKLMVQTDEVCTNG